MWKDIIDKVANGESFEEATKDVEEHIKPVVKRRRISQHQIRAIKRRKLNG